MDTTFIFYKYASSQNLPNINTMECLYIQCKEQYHQYNWNASEQRLKLKHLFLNTFQCGVIMILLHYI